MPASFSWKEKYVSQKKHQVNIHEQCMHEHTYTFTLMGISQHTRGKLQDIFDINHGST